MSWGRRLLCCLRQPEVQHLHLPSGVIFTFAGLRSRWTIDFFVRGFERLADAVRDIEGLIEGIGPRWMRSAKRLAFDEFEHEKTGPFRLLKIVDRRNVRMIQRRQNFGLALKPAHSRGIMRKLLWQDLDRDLAFQLRVPGAIHLSHAALAEQTSDLMRTELRTDGQRHDFEADYKSKKVSGRITGISESGVKLIDGEARLCSSSAFAL